MRDAFDVIKQSLGDVWEDLWTTLAGSLLWLVSVALVLPAPAVTLGLFYYANRRAHGEAADFRDIWRGIRMYWKAAYLWALLNLAVVLLLVGDIALTGQATASSAMNYTRGLYFTLAGFWLLLQLYTLPFLFEQERPSIINALRNAAVMIGRNPFFSLSLFVFLAILLGLGSMLFLASLAVGGCLLAYVGNRSVLNRLASLNLTVDH
jgi:hypothetical protein